MRSFTLFLVALVVALALAASAAASVTKYTFSPVTFPGGTAGIIYASVKVTNRSTFTNCNYHSGTGAFLGDYSEEGVVPADVEKFCLDHFPNRST